MANKKPTSPASAPAHPEVLEPFLDLAKLLLTQLNEIAKDPTRVADADWLLGRNVGVIGGFNLLSAAVARVLGRAPAPTISNIGGDVPDDAEIQQRITAELDRIAARTRAVRGDPENGTDGSGTAAADGDVETLARAMGSGSA